MNDNPTPIRIIVETVTSRQDTNGNSYHFATFWNPAKGRNECVSMEVGGRSNAAFIARSLVGNDYAAVLSFGRIEGKSAWRMFRKSVTLFEGTAEAKAALEALMKPGQA